MRVLSLSAALLSGFLTCSSAFSDLDPSVWKNVESKVGARTVNRVSNRPIKRQSGWSPPSDLSTALTEVWEHYESTYDGGVFSNINWGWQQIMANEGGLQICVRWDSTASVTEAQRTQIAAKYAEQYEKWFTWVYGFDGFPYSAIDVKIVGWAVKDKSLLEGSTDGIDVYTDLDADGIPMCAVGCSRDAHLDSDYSGCAGGFDSHYDQSLWLTDGLEGGYGYSWGQNVGREYFMNNLESENIHILLHEMGHTFGLDDFYDWTPTGVTNFVMLAGSAMEVTDFDGWMFRNWWYELAQKYNWTSGNTDTTSTASAKSPAATTSATTSAATSSATKTPATTAPASTAPATTVALYPTPTPTPSGAPSRTKTRTRTRTRPSKPVHTPSQATPVHTPIPTPVSSHESGSVAAKKWGQCGGIGHSGSTSCAEGLECVQQNIYYYQCL